LSRNVYFIKINQRRLGNSQKAHSTTNLKSLKEGLGIQLSDTELAQHLQSPGSIPKRLQGIPKPDAF
jgi:hypothetical protein